MTNTQLDMHIFWQGFLNVIEDKINAQSYSTWFKPLSLKEITDTKVVISVPEAFYVSWLEEHYHPLITSISSKLLGREMTVSFHVNDDTATEPVIEAPALQQVPDNIPHDKSPLSYGQLTINPRFTFDSFVVGNSNQFAYAAAKAVSDAPGKTAFNPLVIYGGVGLGKTHILQAVAHQFLQSTNNGTTQNRVIYVSSEKFTMDFILSIQNNETTQYSKFYRSADLLLVDDIQFFNNKERTQEEFFHIFNDLHQHGKQIVLTMDCPPSQLKGLADRLINRFQWGLVTDIQSPDFETRVAILKKKADNDNVELDSDIAEFIANHITSNIRELEGALIRLLAFSSLHGRDLTLDMAQEVLGDTIIRNSRLITIESIQKVVAKHLSLSPDQLIGNSRRKEVAFARHVAIFLCKQLTSSSLKTIGLHFGGRDHSTIIHSLNRIDKDLKTDKDLEGTIQTLTEKIKNAE